MRLALGATANRVVAEFVADSLRVIAVGAIAGWIVAFVLAVDVLSGGPIDVTVFTVVPAILLLVAAIAAWLPARHATRLIQRRRYDSPDLHRSSFRATTNAVTTREIIKGSTPAARRAGR